MAFSHLPFFILSQSLWQFLWQIQSILIANLCTELPETANIGSLVVSLTIVPVLGSLIIKHFTNQTRENLLIRVIHVIYTPLLSLAIRGRWILDADTATAITVDS